MACLLQAFSSASFRGTTVKAKLLVLPDQHLWFDKARDIVRKTFPAVDCLLSFPPRGTAFLVHKLIAKRQRSTQLQASNFFRLQVTTSLGYNHTRTHTHTHTERERERKREKD